MTITTTLNELAEVLKCHPRTILRAITRKKNPYWVEGYDPNFWETHLAFLDISSIRQILNGKDEFLKPAEAAKYLNIHPRTFRYRKYIPTIRFGKIVRYSKNYLKQFLKKDVP